MAASMTLEMGNTDKLAEFRDEAERLGIKVEPPSVNRSGVEFEVDGNTIHYALAALRGVGRQAVETVLAARAERPFTDISDFGRRINPRAVNKRVLESLAAAGAFDCIEANRARAAAAVDGILATAQRTHDDVARGQSELFAGAAAHSSIVVPELEPWLPAERLQREYEAVGFFLSGHPLDDYGAALKRLRVQSWVEFARAVKTGAGAGRVAGTVVSRTERRTKTGSKMGIIGLSDPSGHYEAVLFAEGLAQYRDLLEPGTAVLLFLTAEVQGDEVRARIQSVEPLDQAAARMHRGLRVFLRDPEPLAGVARRLEASPKAGNGNGNRAEAADGEVSMVLLLQNGSEVEVKLPGRFKVSPQIAGAIKAVSGVVTVEAL
jgi:DNA polymerase-3 subunit alpha